MSLCKCVLSIFLVWLARHVDVGVRCPVLVPFLLCPPKRPLWGGVKAWGQLPVPDTLYVAYWNLNLLSPGSRQPYWRSSCNPFRCALARVPSGVMWLLPRRSTQSVKLVGGGLPPICRPHGFPPSRPHGCHSEGP